MVNPPSSGGPDRSRPWRARFYCLGFRGSDRALWLSPGGRPSSETCGRSHEAAKEDG
jgi:hypothetical protein